MMPEISFTIGSHTITRNSRPFVITELGNNHNCSVNLCKTMITRAKANGADAVKLQKRDPKSLYTKSFYDSPYASENSFGPTYGLHREALEFNRDQWRELLYHAKSENILLFSTAFDEKSVEFLEKLDIPAYKIASACLCDIPLIKLIASTKKPIIISTGGSSWQDVDRVYTLLTDYGAAFSLLHCTMQYPTEPANVNLRIISQMNIYYQRIIGFSDHTVGTWAIPAAYLHGARIFEKHFTTNRALPGPDHALSIEPDELQSLVHTLDRIRIARGSSIKQFLDCEQKGYYKMGKGLYAAWSLDIGHILRMEDIAVMSPAEGLPPHKLEEVVGKKVNRFVGKGEAITNEVIDG